MTPYDKLPIADLALDATERAEALAALQQLTQDLGAPGDYGYASKLGVLIQAANDLRAEIEATPARLIDLFAA